MRGRFPSYKYLHCQVESVCVCVCVCVGWKCPEADRPPSCLVRPFALEVSPGGFSALHWLTSAAQHPYRTRGLWTCLLNTSSWDSTTSGPVLGKKREDEFTVRVPLFLRGGSCCWCESGGGQWVWGDTRGAESRGPPAAWSLICGSSSFCRVNTRPNSGGQQEALRGPEQLDIQWHKLFTQVQERRRKFILILTSTEKIFPSPALSSHSDYPNQRGLSTLE